MTPSFTRSVARETIGALSAPARRWERMRRREVTKRVVPPPLPADPFSDAYRAWVFDLYRAVAGRDDYAVELESASFDLEAAILRPHPFATGSPAVVGDDLSARGSVGGSTGTHAAGAHRGIRWRVGEPHVRPRGDGT